MFIKARARQVGFYTINIVRVIMMMNYGSNSSLQYPSIYLRSSPYSASDCQKRGGMGGEVLEWVEGKGEGREAIKCVYTGIIPFINRHTSSSSTKCFADIFKSSEDSFDFAHSSSTNWRSEGRLVGFSLTSMR